MVARQFVLRKKVGNVYVRLRASEAEQMNARCYTQLDFVVVVWVILLEYQFPGKV